MSVFGYWCLGVEAVVVVGIFAWLLWHDLRHSSCGFLPSPPPMPKCKQPAEDGKAGIMSEKLWEFYPEPFDNTEPPPAPPNRDGGLHYEIFGGGFIESERSKKRTREYRQRLSEYIPKSKQSLEMGVDIASDKDETVIAVCCLGRQIGQVRQQLIEIAKTDRIIIVNTDKKKKGCEV